MKKLIQITLTILLLSMAVFPQWRGRRVWRPTYSPVYIAQNYAISGIVSDGYYAIEQATITAFSGQCFGWRGAQTRTNAYGQFQLIVPANCQNIQVSAQMNGYTSQGDYWFDFSYSQRLDVTNFVLLSRNHWNW